MKAQNSGRIVSVASLGGQIGGMKVTPGYVASKAGVVGLTKSYARNGAKYGITANAVAPGPTETNMAKGRYSADTTMLGRLAEPMDVAKVILFLSSTLADYLTGVTVDVNGGALMR
jgi:3-oxoacyl-[acyl-carrier protein] reductase